MTRTDSTTKNSSRRQRRTRLAVSHEELIPGTRLTASLKGKTYEAEARLGDGFAQFAVDKAGVGLTVTKVGAQWLMPS